MEWAYKYVVDIRNPKAGYQEFDIAPEFDYRLDNVNCYFDSPYGKIAVAYQIETDAQHTITLDVTVPFGSTAHVTLPRSEKITVLVNDQTYIGGTFDLTAGTYHINYIPSQDYIEHYSAETIVAEIMADSYLVEQIDTIDPVLNFFRNDPDAVNGGLGKMSLAKLNSILPFITISDENLAKIAAVLESTPILSQR